MSHELLFDKRIIVGEGEAQHFWNFYGMLNRKDVVFEDYFVRIALDSTNLWAVAVPGSTDS